MDDLAAFCANATANALELDEDGSFPERDVKGLGELGLLHAPLPVNAGGSGLAQSVPVLRRILGLIGRANLSLGRLYEGHVNAIGLVELYGAPHHLERLRREADAGRLTGVWNAEGADGLHLVEENGRMRLAGRKIWASGACHIRCPLVTAALPGSGGMVMVLPELDTASRADNSGWRPHGMRASETGTVDFSGLEIDDDQIVGEPGDYYRSPHFAGGAWRVIAVQLGAMEALFEHFRLQLKSGPRVQSDHYRTLLGRAGVALETARLWVTSASDRISQDGDSADIDAYVNLARTAFERCALDVMECVQRGLGLNAFMRQNEIERLARDLATYLRQPFPDKALGQAIDRLLDDPAGVLRSR